MGLLNKLINVFELLVNIFELLRELEIAFVEFEEVDELEEFVGLVELSEEGDVFHFLQMLQFGCFVVGNFLAEFVFFGSELYANLIDEIVGLEPGGAFGCKHFKGVGHL
jgi:hypothetical protein